MVKLGNVPQYSDPRPKASKTIFSPLMGPSNKQVTRHICEIGSNMNNPIEINNPPTSLQSMRSSQAEGNPPPRDTAVILHLYYPDLWDETRGYLANLGADFDLYVSVCETATQSDMARIKQCYPNAFVCNRENRGRDIGPFVEIYPLLQERYRYICKIHTKKSTQIANGDARRQDLYDKLLGSSKRVAEVKAIFEAFPDIGMVVPEGKLLHCRKHLGANAAQITALTARMGANGAGDFNYFFPSGSMFWFRAGALSPLRNLNLKQESFEPEHGQLDGTLAHAVERIFSLATKVAGYETVDTHFFELVENCVGADWRQTLARLQDAQDNADLPRSLTKCLYKLGEIDKEVNTLRIENDALYKSTSWKITAPLRQAHGLISRWIWRR